MTKSKARFFFARVSYTVALLFYLLIFLPKFLFARLCHGKYKKNFIARLTGKGPIATSFPVIWFHAVSVGETRALTAFIPFVRQAYPDAFLFVSTVTDTGLAVAEKIPEANACAHLPIDLPWVATRFVRRLKPDLLVLVEGDYWFHLINKVKQRGGKVIVISGKLSHKSMQRYARTSFFSRPLFDLIDHFCLQNEQYKKRFRFLAIPEEKMTIAGNLKFDLAQSMLSLTEKKSLQHQLGITDLDDLIVVGSTHAKEEKALIDRLHPWLKKYPRLKVLFLPRHPERFAEVAQLLREAPFEHTIVSRETSTTARMILVDRMGILSSCYQLAMFAIVGGSYFPGVGGHDIFEPVKFGIPVLFGPYMHTQKEFVELIIQAQAGDQTNLENLSPMIGHLLAHPKERQKRSEQGKQLAHQMRGTANCHWEKLRPLFFSEKSFS